MTACGLAWGLLWLVGCATGDLEDPPGTLLWVDASAVGSSVVGRRSGQPWSAPDLPGATFAGPIDPQGTHVLLVSSEDHAGEHIEQLWRVGLDSGEVQPLSDRASKVRNPRWSRDGSWIVFESSRESFRDLYRVSRFGQGLTRLTEAPGGSFEPDVSPDGSILFGSSRAGNAELYRLDPDSGQTRRLTDHPTDDVRPTWSPSGQHIAWLSSREGVPQVWRMDASGSAPQRLWRSETSGVDLDVRWSPTEDRLAVVSRLGSDSVRLTVVSLGGEVMWQASAAPVQEHPQWSADGAWLAWTATTDGQSRIWAARSDGSQARQVAADGWLPRWGR